MFLIVNLYNFKYIFSKPFSSFFINGIFMLVSFLINIRVSKYGGVLLRAYRHGKVADYKAEELSNDEHSKISENWNLMMGQVENISKPYQSQPSIRPRSPCFFRLNV